MICSREAGAAFKRFEQVPAFGRQIKRQIKDMARQLRANLPQFQWLEKSQADKALLTFDLQANDLNVKTVQGNSLHRYKVAEDLQLVSTVTSAPRPYLSANTEPATGPLQKL